MISSLFKIEIDPSDYWSNRLRYEDLFFDVYNPNSFMIIDATDEDITILKIQFPLIHITKITNEET